MSSSEKFTVSGSQLVEKVKQIIHQGNIRRVRLIHRGRPLIDIPLTVGVPAAPVLAAIAAIAALVTDCTIEVEKAEKTDQGEDQIHK